MRACLFRSGAKYLLSFVVEEGGMDDASPEEMRESMERWRAFDDETTERGALIACEPLENSSAATTGGFCLLECESFEEAVEWAHKVPLRSGSIEIRPVMDLSGFGYESRTRTPAKAKAKAKATLS